MAISHPEHKFFENLYRGRSFRRSLDDATREILAHRICPLGPHASGFEDVYAAGGKFLVTVRDIRTRREFHDQSIGLGRLVIVFHVAGRREIRIGLGPSILLEDGRLGVYFHGSGQPMYSTWAAGSHEKSVIIGSWPHEFPSIIGMRIDILRELVDIAGQPQVLNMPMPVRTRRAVEDIINPRVSYDLMPRFLEAKALEVFCLAVESLTHQFMAPGRAEDAKREAVVALLPRIDRALQEPLDAGFLARSLGLGRRSFFSLFRDVTGKSYPEYVSALRLERSRQLIETTNMPLKQIAHAVGYHHVSNLSLSISRAFGMSPRKLRARALAFRGLVILGDNSDQALRSNTDPSPSPGKTSGLSQR